MGFEKIICPVCGQYEFEEKYDICPVCNWEYDHIQLEDPDFSGGANTLSLNEYIKWYQEGVQDEEDH